MNPNGVIDITNKERRYYLILVSKSYFVCSRSIKQGGSISVKYAACIQYRICSINSVIPNKAHDKNYNYHYGCHSFVDTSGKKHITESSISSCNGYSGAVMFSAGEHLIDSSNFTRSKCVKIAAFFHSHLINYTNICDNTAEAESITFHFNSKSYFSHCNIIGNTVGNGEYYRTIINNWGHDDITISYSVFEKKNNTISLIY